MPELMVILGIAFLCFGGKKLPELGAGLGRGISSFKKGLREAEQEVDAPRQQLVEDKVAAPRKLLAEAEVVTPKQQLVEAELAALRQQLAEAKREIEEVKVQGKGVSV